MTAIVEGTVQELRDAVRDLLQDEDARGQGLTSRATGLTGFVGVIVSVAAAAGAIAADGPATQRPLAVVAAVSVALALVALLAAVVIVVLRVLLPSPGVRIATAEVERYQTLELVAQPRVMIQGQLLRAYVEALARERDRNEEKAQWLKLGYLAVAIGLGLVILGATAATIDMHLSDSLNERRIRDGR